MKQTARRGLVVYIGHRILAFVRYLGSFCLLLAQILKALLTGRLRINAFWQECLTFGNRSFWIVGLISFFMGMVVAMEAATPLKLTGGEFYVGTAVSLAAVRELGPILVAFLLTGRVGAAIAAEVGTMKITEQLDALKTLAVDPVEYLVVPKFLAGILMLPVLTVLANAIQITGGFVVGTTTLNLSTALYFFQAFRFINIRDIAIGLLKAAVFGAVIVTVSAREGFSAEGGAKGVGRATTLSVVIAFFMIIVADLIITALFYFL